jgi:ribonucleoside-diphosphate reductase alpha chain
VFTVRPEAEEFYRFMGMIEDHQTGEPGIFNRTAATAQATRWGRRRGDVLYGCNPCGEIILRDRQLCNLSAAVARPSDDLDTLLRKYGYAVDFGCMQAELTNFRYLSPEWQSNCEEERLAGASLDGIPDHPVLNGSEGIYELKKWLNALRDHGRRVAEGTSAQLGITVPKAIGTLKPAGNSSFLHGAPSPLKPHHAKFYKRRTRINKTDPVYGFFKAIGVPMEDEIAHPDSTAVITWPMRAPEGAVTRDDWTALQQLDLWRTYRNEFCEHNPSVTINVKHDEWAAVADWCWEHFDELTGITFLPHDGGTYVQAPYEECSKEEYRELLAEMPTDVDWSGLQYFEAEDMTTGTHELACSSGVCEVDLAGV